MQRELPLLIHASWTHRRYTASVCSTTDLVAEVLEGAGYITQKYQLRRITPRMIMLAVQADEEFADLLHGVTFPTSGELHSVCVILPSWSTDNL